MDATTALQALSDRYAYALRMRHEGLDDQAIGRVLELDPVTVQPFLTIAEAKVADLIGGRADVPNRGTAEPPDPASEIC